MGKIITIVLLILLSGCTVLSLSAINENRYKEGYRTGYASLEKDVKRYETDIQYKQGWIDGVYDSNNSR